METVDGVGVGTEGFVCAGELGVSVGGEGCAYVRGGSVGVGVCVRRHAGQD